MLTWHGGQYLSQMCALGFARESERETISRMLSDDADANAIHYQRHKLVFRLWFARPFEVDADSCMHGMGIYCHYGFQVGAEPQQQVAAEIKRRHRRCSEH